MAALEGSVGTQLTAHQVLRVMVPPPLFPSYLRVPAAWQCLPQDITEAHLCGTAFGKRFLHSST